MLNPTAPVLHVTAIGLAHDGEPESLSATAAHCSSSAPLLDLATAALSQTIAADAFDPGAVRLVVFGSDDFNGDRAPGSSAQERGPLLGNAFNDTVVRRLVLDSGLTAAQPHGVFLAEGLAWCASLATARGFVVAEDELRDVVVVTTHGRHPGRRSASACLVSCEPRSAPILASAKVVTTQAGARPSELAVADCELLHARDGHVQTSAAALVQRWSATNIAAASSRGCTIVESGVDGVGLVHLLHPAADGGVSK